MDARPIDALNKTFVAMPKILPKNLPTRSSRLSLRSTDWARLLSTSAQASSRHYFASARFHHSSTVLSSSLMASNAAMNALLARSSRVVFPVDSASAALALAALDWKSHWAKL